MQLKVYVRRYAPFASFGGGFKGDNRFYSEDIDATCKTCGIAPIEKTAVGLTVLPPTGLSTGSSHRLSGKVRGRASGSVAATLLDVKSGEDNVSFTLYTEGNLPLGSMLKSAATGRVEQAKNRSLQGSPDIDTFLDIQIQISQGQLRASGKVRGDGFPHLEVFIKDDAGGSFGLVNWHTRSGWHGPFHRLFGSHSDYVLAEFDRSTSFDQGRFTSSNEHPPIVHES